jgi:hypothetical protein
MQYLFKSYVVLLLAAWAALGEIARLVALGPSCG